MAADPAEPRDIPRLGSVFGRYRLDTLVGRGGMGVVFRATDLSLERPVALKFLSPALPTDPSFQERFVRESRLAAAIEHPAIVPVYEAGAIGEHLYIAMRFVPGRDLGAILRLEAPLGLERTIALIGPVSGALDAAHRRGLMHRDVKPANVLVEEGPEERAYLADFGLSRRLGDLTAPTRSGPIGTLDYVAPEIVRQGEVTGRADQYALACVVFHCLTGSPPYSGASDASVLQAHLEAEVPNASSVEPGLPRHVDDALIRALSKSPADRFSDCRSFVAALSGQPSAVAAPRPRPGAPTPVPSTPTRRPRIRRRLAMVLAAVGLAMVVAAGVLLAVPGSPALDDVGPAPSGAAVTLPPASRGAGLAVRPGEVIVFSSDTDSDYDLFALHPSSERPTRLTNTSRDERSPAISPDGTTIAYVVGSEPRRDIWLMDADGGRPRALVTNPADDSNPAWSSDGKSLAFHSGRNDPDLDIFEIRDRGTGLQQKNARARTSDPAAEQQPSWAPGSRRLAIAANYLGGYRDIFVIDLDDPRVRLRRTATREWDLNPAFSPEGGAIAFTRRTFCPTCPGSRGQADVYTIRPGQDERRLTSTLLRDEKDSAWSPDGRALAYVAGPADATQLYAMTADGKRSRRLLRGWVSVVEPSWGRTPAPTEGPEGSPSPGP
jgi:serine/threonine-protein kinase